MKQLYLLIVLFCTAFSTQAYTSNYNELAEVQACPDTIICDILINGESLDGFHPDTTYYTVVLPDSITTLPMLIPVVCDSTLSCVVTYTASTLPLPDIVTFFYECEDSCNYLYSVYLTTESMALVEEGKNQIEMYPNPAKNFVNIYINNPSLTNLSLVDFSGRLLQSIDIPDGQEDYQLDVSKYPSGMYFIEVHLDGKLLQSEKLIIE